VSATSFESTQSTISWTASTDDGGATITGYKVTSNPGAKTCITTTTSCVVKGLTNGTDYTFSVVAINARGTSVSSDASNTATPSTVPGVATRVLGVFADSSVNVSWTAPSADGGADIALYTVSASPDGAFCTTATTSCVVPGLVNGTAYRFTVTATNGSGTSASSVASAAVIPMKVPDAPNAPVGVSYLSGRTMLTWTAPVNNAGTPVTGYVVRNANGDQVCTTTGALTCSVTGLTNGTTYTFSVMAKNKVGDGAISNLSDGVLVSTVPNAPTSPTPVFGDRSITVFWTAPVDNGGAPITGYVVANATATLGCTTNGETNCVVTGLTNGTAYTFRVLAINGSGRGASSGYTVATVPATVPNPPTNVTTVFGNASATVTWTTPADNGGSIVTGFSVTANPGGRTCTTTSVTATTCVVNGLANGTAYTFTVTATNKAGTGSASNPSAPVVPATVPDQPTDVATSFDVVTGIMTITWVAPVWNGGSAITGFSVLSTPGNKGCTTTGALTCTITGLTNGTVYTFAVKATNKAGSGTSSAPSASTIPIMVPEVPTNVTGTFGNTTATIRWTAPVATSGTTVTGYTVTTSPDGAICTTAGATTCTVTGLANGTAYTFTVTATNIVGTGKASTASAPVIPATVPSAPTVTSVAYDDSSVTVTWTASDDSGGSVITDYIVTSKPGTKTCTTTGALTCTITGLTNGTAYTFTVKAVNKAGSGVASVASDSIIPGTVPGVPLNVAATSYENSRSTVTWSAPATNGGYAITRYVVIASDGQECEPARLTTLTCTFTGLRNGSRYTFTVYAGNLNGLSGGVSDNAKPATVPDAPFDVVATSYEGSQSTVSWTAPTFNGGAIITRYTVTSNKDNKICTVEQVNISTPAATTCIVTGLENGTTYRFTVTATNRNGTGDASDRSNVALPSRKPGAPEGPTTQSCVRRVCTDVPTLVPSVSSTTGKTVVVTWTAPRKNSGGINDGGAPIQGYIVVSEPASDRCFTTSATVTSCTFTWLNNGTSYKFRVMAYNAAGTSERSLETASITPVSVPEAPTGVAATSFQDSKSTVSWSVPFNNGLAITGYTVTSTPGSKTCTTTSATSCVVTGLTNGTVYSFSVTATNSKGVSPESDSYYGALPSKLAAAPTIGITIFGDRSVTVFWSVPSTNGGAPIRSYTVTSTPGSFTCTTSALSCTVSGLTNGSAYTFRVVATNGSGNSPASSESVSTTPLAVPKQPTGVVATSGADAQSVVSWTAPTNIGGTPITGYTVTSTPEYRTCSTTTATTCTVTGLKNGVDYTFTVVATNLVGTGEASVPSAFAKPSRTPDAPSISAATTLHRAATIAWNPPGFDGGVPVTSYTVLTYVGTDLQNGFSCTGSSTTRSCTIDGLTYGVAYNFKVSATNDRGTGENSNTSDAITPIDPPTAPLNVTATSFENSRSTVSWTAPADFRGSAITSYVVTSESGDSTCNANSGTSCIVTGLTNGREYRFTVVARNAAGSGDISSFTAWVTPSVVPTAPTVRSVTVGIASATVTATAPSSNGGAPITSYTIVSFPEGKSCTATDPGVGCTVTGLTNGTSYTFSVAAVNGSGIGAFSAASAPVTPSGPPDAPSALTVKVGNASVTVAWTAPFNGGSAITGYVVTSSPGGLICSPTTVVGVDATKCTVSGLTNGTTYTFTVRATNSIGTGEASLASSEAVPVGVPAAPSAPGITPGNGVVTVTWPAPADGGAAISKYRLQRCLGATCTVIEISSTGTITNVSKIGVTACTFTSLSCTFTGLTNDSDYVFSVAASNKAGYGVASAFSSAATPRTTPNKADLVVATPYNASVLLTWRDPSASGFMGRTYTVTASNGATCSTTNLNGQNGSCLVTGLTNGTSYTFAVRISNSAGTGSASTAVSATPVTLPDEPTSVAGESNKDGQSVVSWTPGSNGGSPIIAYTVSDGAGHSCTTTTTSCTVTGLTNGIGYAFFVTATTAIGSSEASTSSEVATPAKAPSAPNLIRLQQSSATSVLATWETPSDFGGSFVKSYSVLKSDGTTACTASVDDDYRSCTITGLTSGTRYTYTVTATNDAGTSLKSNALSITVGTASSTAKIRWIRYVSDLKGIRTTWEWAPSTSGTVTVYAYKAGTTFNVNTAAQCSSSGTACWVDVPSDGSYSLKVYSTVGNNSTVQGSIAAVSVYDESTSPRSVSAVAGVRSAVVSWTEPRNTGGLPIASYMVESSPGGLKCKTLLLSCTVFGLRKDTSYTFTVVARNGIRQSEKSEPSASITTFDVPAAPTSVTAVAGQGSAVVSWSTPGSDGGSPITGYRVLASPGGARCLSTSTSCTFTGLTPGTGYTFTVKAINAVGAGAFSNASAAVTPLLVLTVPGIPGFRDLIAEDTLVTIYFSEPNDGNSRITRYTVTASPGGATCNNFADGNLRCVIRYLTNGAAYTFTVTATNAIGTSAASAPSRSVIPSTEPGAPANVTATDIPGAAIVRWNAPVSTGGQEITFYKAYAWVPGANGVISGGPGSCTTETGSTLTCTITGLTNGSSYMFYVQAFNDRGRGLLSSASSSVLIRTVPGAPVIENQESGIGSIRVRWSAPAFDGGTAITTYTVKSSGGQSCTGTGSERSCVLNGLLANRSYSFTVFATNVVGDGSSSPAVAGYVPLTAAPSKPSFTKVYSTGPETVKAKWAAPNANGAEITSYVVTSYDTTASAGGPGCTSVLTECDMTGFVSGHKYTFSLTATNSVGTSAAGTITVTAGLTFNPDPANGMFFLPVQATFDENLNNFSGTGSATTSLVMGFESSAAMDKTVITSSNGSAVVTWSTPTLANGRTIVGYVVTVKSTTSLQYCVTTTSSCMVKNLNGSSGYTFSVTPFSGGLLPVMVRGMGLLSWTVVSLPSLAPERRNLRGSITTTAPKELRATPGFGSVTLSWLTPGNFKAPQMYLVQDSTNAFSCLTSGTACTVGGLTNGTDYSFTVRAVQIDEKALKEGSVIYQSGSASSSVSATPLNTIPKDSFKINAAYSVSALMFAMSSMTDPYKFVGNIVVDTQAMRVLVDWTNGESWTVTASSTPSAPTAVAITRSDPAESTMARISWIKSASTGGIAITRYTAKLESVGLTEPIVRTCSAAGSATFCEIINLPSDVAFIASVVATNLAGDSLPGITNLPGVTLRDTDVPSAPRSVLGVSGISSVLVSWTAPLSANGSTIVKYSVTTDKIGSTDNTEHTCETTTGLSCTLTGLLNGVAYTVRVTATNSSGTSESTRLTTANGRSATNITAGFLSAPDPLVPGAITKLNVVSRTPVDGGIMSNNAVITWAAAPNNGSEITGYVVTASADNLQCIATKTSCVIANLVDGRKYTFTVVAYNRVGYSESVTSNEITGGLVSDGTVAPPTSSVSFFGADPVKVSGTVTASLVNGKVVLSGTLTSDKFTAKAGSLTLTETQMVWRAEKQGADEAGWSGTGTLALGFGIKITMKVSSYTDSGNWTLTALVTTGKPELLKGMLTLPEFSFGGTVSSSNGTVVWSLGATMGQLNVIPGLLKLTDTALSISNACPVLLGTTTRVCPRGNNGIYLSILGKFTVTIANTDYASVSGYLVAGLDSRTVVLTVKFGDINFGGGVKLTSPMLQVYQATPGVDPTAAVIAASTIPGQPRSVQGEPVNAMGEARVGWLPPLSNGGSIITGYTVVATPVTKFDDTVTLQPVTCTVGADSVTVTTTPVKAGSDYAKANPKRSTKSVTTMNTFCEFTGLNYGTDYTYSVTANNANGPGVAAVSSEFKGVKLSVDGMDKAQLIIVMSGGLALTDFGLSFQVEATVFPLGSDFKPLTAKNALAPGVPAMWGWAIAGTVSSEQAKNAKSFIPASLAGSFAFTTNEAKAIMNGDTVTLPERSVFFGVTMTLSNGMKQVIKGVDSLNGYVWYSISTGEWELKISLSSGWVAKVGKVELNFVTTSIVAAGVGVNVKTFGITEEGTVKFPNNDGSMITIRAGLGVSLLNMSSIVFGITLSPATPDGAIWPNMFGYKGFNLVTGSLSVGFDMISGFPILGLMGTVEFPASVTKILGGTAPVTVTLAGNMSTQNPCAYISVEASDGVSNVVNIANGVITASKFQMGLAPDGCTIGAGEQAFVMAAGASLSVAGSIMGVPIKISMSITIEEKATGVPDVTITGSATVGAFSLGELKMDPSVLEVNLTNKIGGLEHFKLSGGASVLGMKLTVLAEANYVLGSLDLDMKMAASINHATIGGIGFDEVAFSFSLSTTRLSAFSVAFSAKMTLAPGFSVAVSGAISPTEFKVTADTTINWGGFQYRVATTAILSMNGDVPLVSVSTLLSINLWGTYFSGTMSVTNDANGFRSVSTFAIQLKIGGWELGDATYTETVTISGDTVMFRRKLTSQLNLAVIKGTLNAEVAAGMDGDKPVLLLDAYIEGTLDIGVFSVTTKVHLSDCGDPCVRYTGVVFEISVSAEILGRRLTSPFVGVNLDFSFDINFSTSFNTTSGIVYGCVKCTDPDSAGLLRWQSWFSGSRQISISSSRGVSFSASAKAKIQESASKSTCTKRDSLGTCWGWDYSWGSFVDKIDVGVSFDSRGNASVEWAGKKFNVDL
jgi:titin